MVFRDLVEKSLEIALKPEVKKLLVAASLVEKRGYCEWPRLREVAEFAKLIDAEKIGLAFCIGLSNEALAVADYLRRKGFQVFSVCCKCGAIDKSRLGLGEEDKLRKGFEAMCNPVLQALILNKLNTNLNITVGLCVGHDAVFTKISKAPVVCLIAKDRVTGHNPALALYVPYLRRRL